MSSVKLSCVVVGAFYLDYLSCFFFPLSHIVEGSPQNLLLLLLLVSFLNGKAHKSRVIESVYMKFQHVAIVVYFCPIKNFF